MLLYTKELVAPRPKLRPGLLRFDRNLLRKKYNKMLRIAFDHSTIHGMHNACHENHLWVKCFWLIVVVLATFGFCLTYSILDDRHREQVLVSVVTTTQLPVLSIEFPAVAICPWNHVNWMRASTAADRFLPSNADHYVREAFRQLLIGMEQVTFGKFQTLGALSSRNLTALAHLSLSKLASYLAYRCDEILVPDSCVFDESPFDCCQLFVAESTEKGQCLVFNSMISEDSRKKRVVNEYYPYKISTAGEGSGLQFTLRLNDSFLRQGTRVPFSMNLIIKQARQWSHPVIYHLYSNTENFVAVEPLIIETSNNTMKMHPSKRKCYFGHERNPHYSYSNSELPYSRENCIASCLQMSVLDNCRCTMPLFLPPIEGTRECNVLDIDCVYRHRDVFGYVKMRGQEKYINDTRRGQYCNCPDSCNTQQYNVLLNVRKLEAANVTDKSQFKKRIRTEVYYGQRVMTRIETKLQYTFTDLLAGFGGILALYIGASALSFVELAYVMAKLIWHFVKDAYTKIISKRNRVLIK